MKLILTNDDGIDAPGLAALARVCEGLGERIVVAPAEAQSGVSHRVTTHAPIRVVEHDARRIEVHGTPADCSRLALTHVATDASWLLAGINFGGNLGCDVYISGTVAAAREATLLGCNAIAISHYVSKNRALDWDLAVARAAPLIRRLLDEPPGKGRLWNVNLPHPQHDDVDCDVVLCDVDVNPLDVRFVRTGAEFVYDGNYFERRRSPGLDVDVCLGGKIAVSSVRV